MDVPAPDAAVALPDLQAGDISMPPGEATIAAGATLPTVDAPDADVDISAPEVTLPAVEASLPEAGVDASLPSADVAPPVVDVSVPTADAAVPPVGVPAAEFGADVPSVDVGGPAADADVPSVDVAGASAVLKPKKSSLFKGMFGRKKDMTGSLPGVPRSTRMPVLSIRRGVCKFGRSYLVGPMHHGHCHT